MKMKILAIFTVLIALCLRVSAGEFDHLGPAWTAPWATVYTNTFSYTTNAAGLFSLTNSFLSDKAIYHTFLFANNLSGNNTNQVYIDSSIDNVTFVNVYSNTIVNGADVEYQFTGESLYFQERMTVLASGSGTIAVEYAAH